MRVAVTGGTGFVSAAVARAPTDVDLGVTALTRRPDDRGAERVMGADIGDAQSLRRALDGQKPVYSLVHFLDVEDRRAVGRVPTESACV